MFQTELVKYFHLDSRDGSRLETIWKNGHSYHAKKYCIRADGHIS